MTARLMSWLDGALLTFSGRQVDLSSEEGRGKERHRRVVLSAITAAFAKSLSIAATLISVPLTLHYLGPERYGMWMTMSSLVAILSFADLGVGNGLLSAVAYANGRNDRPAIRGLASSAFSALSGIAVFILIIFAALYPFISWQALFNVRSPQAIAEAGPAMVILIVCFSLAIPAAVVQRVQVGLQAGFIANLWQCLASALTLTSVLIAIHLQASLPWLALAFAGSPLLVAALNTGYFFGVSHRDCAPRLAAIRRTTCMRLLHSGVLYLVLQIVAAVTYSSDSIIIAQRLGASAVSQYAVPEKMFGLVAALLAIAIAPLWPAYSEAFVANDHTWIRRTLRRSLFLSTATAATASTALIVLGPWLISLWIGGTFSPSLLLLLGLGVWKTVEAGGNAVAMFLNGASVVRFQVIVAITTAAVAIVLKVVLVDRIGVSGAVWASSIAYLCLAALPMYWFLRRDLLATAQA